MIVHAEVDPHESPALCPYPPAPQNSLFFYINDLIRVKKGESEPFILQPRSVIVGPQLTRVTLDINRSHKAVRVGFHPGGLFRLLGISMSEIVDDNFDATDIFGKEMKEVNQRLQDACTFDGIKDVIESFLIKKVKTLKTALPFDNAMLELMKVSGNIPIERVASMACLSLRQLERVSKERIGLPPKLFARLVRFSKAYRYYETSPKKTWTSIAHECGYYDQMHFIRDFKQFAGMPPGAIEKELTEAPVRLQASLRL
jgi:AraC-like DNA-binding protein